MVVVPNQSDNKLLINMQKIMTVTSSIKLITLGNPDWNNSEDVKIN